MSTIDKLKQQYDDAKPKLVNGTLTPRTGKYLIQAVTQDTIAAFKVPVAQALWSPNLSDLPNGLPVCIQLESLIHPKAIGPQIKFISELLDRSIEVEYGIIREIIGDNFNCNIYVVKWQFIE